MPNIDAPDIMNTNLATLATTLSTLAGYEGKIATRSMGAVPAGTAVALATNGTAITSVTPREIVADPGVGKTLYLAAITVWNTTTGTPVISIIDGASVTLAVVSPGASPNVERIVFEPPIPATAHKNITGQADATAGSCSVLAEYFSV